MKQFFKHFGSKARLAHRLPPPRFNTLIEPFAGSAAYTVLHAKPTDTVLLYDTNERVCMIWDFLIHATEKTILSLPVREIHEGKDIRELGLSHEEFLFLQRWITLSGSHQYSMPPCLRGDGSASDKWGTKVRARIARQVNMIRHWKIEQSPYTTAPDIEAHWHIDPPYQSNKIGFSEYKCEPPDYESLAQWCLSRRGDVTVHEQYGAEWLPFETLNSHSCTSAQQKNGKEKIAAHEVYWTNEKRASNGTLHMF